MKGFGELDATDRASISKMINTFSEWLESRPSKPAKRKAAGTDSSPKKKPAGIAPLFPVPGPATAAAAAASTGTATASAGADGARAAHPSVSSDPATPTPVHRSPLYDLSKSTGFGPDNSFFEFTQLCNRIAAEPSHTGKTRLVREFLSQGSTGSGFTGDPYLLLRLLLPLHPKRVYNMKDKQMVKIFSQMFRCS